MKPLHDSTARAAGRSDALPVAKRLAVLTTAHVLPAPFPPPGPVERDVTAGPLVGAAAVGVLQLLHASTGLELLLVTLGDDRTDTHHVLACVRGGTPDRGGSRRWSVSVGLQMVQGHGPTVAPRLRDVPAYRATDEARAGWGCFAGAILQNHDGHVVGAITGFGWATRDETMLEVLPHFRTAAELLGAVLVATSQVADQLDQMRAAHTAELGLALTDPVTGLANRTGLEVTVSRLQEDHHRSGRPVTVVVCDVDGLKRVNDTLGHQAGDDLLRRVADILRSAARPTDVVGRLGGDEFLVLLVDELPDGPTVHRLRTALAVIPVSVGRAGTGDHHSLLIARHHADLAMYAHKRRRQ